MTTPPPIEEPTSLKWVHDKAVTMLKAIDPTKKLYLDTLALISRLNQDLTGDSAANISMSPDQLAKALHTMHSMRSVQSSDEEVLSSITVTEEMKSGNKTITLEELEGSNM